MEQEWLRDDQHDADGAERSHGEPERKDQPWPPPPPSRPPEDAANGIRGVGGRTQQRVRHRQRAGDRRVEDSLAAVAEERLEHRIRDAQLIQREIPGDQHAQYRECRERIRSDQAEGSYVQPGGIRSAAAV